MSLINFARNDWKRVFGTRRRGLVIGTKSYDRTLIRALLSFDIGSSEAVLFWLLVFKVFEGRDTVEYVMDIGADFKSIWYGSGLL